MGGMFENWIMTIIFGPMSDKGVIKSRRLRWAGHVASPSALKR